MPARDLPRGGDPADEPHGRADGARRRSEILDTAAAVFARKGVAAATVRDIAEEAHILSGSLYHHFDSKDQMIEEILRFGFEALVAGYRTAIEANGSARDAVRDLVRAGVTFMMDEPVVGTIIRNDSRTLQQTPRFAFIIDYKHELERLVTGVLAQGVATGDLRADLDMEVSYYVLSDAVLGAARYPSLGARRPAEVAELISEVVVRGLAVDRDDDQALARAGRRT